MSQLPLQFAGTAQLHAALVSGDVTSVEVVQACLRQIEKLNPELNAFLHVDADGALRQAEVIDQKKRRGEKAGLLAGLPLGLKDNICQSSQPVTCGSRMLRDFVPPYDSHVVERIRAEDGVILGRLNMDEFAMGSSTETSTAGPARNPWDHARTAGGSSGGSAVAVASGMLPLSLGSDTGGSIRQPASFCGVVGMKPTYGTVSRYGLIAYASSLDQIGPLARDVYGVALLLQAIQGHDARDSTSVPQPAVQLSDCLSRSDRPLRIGIVEEHFGDGLDPLVRDSVTQAIRVFEDAGATVQQVRLPHSRYSIAAYYLIACSEASSNLARYDGIHYGYRANEFSDLVDLYSQSRGEAFGAEVKRRIMLGTYALSAGYYDAYYLKALKVRRRIREDFDRAFADVDLIAGPVAPAAAFRLGEKLDDPLAMYLEDIFTIGANLAGLPGISIPCGFTEDRLPIGLQLMAPALQDARLLQAGHLYQQMTDWHQRHPDVSSLEN